MGVRLSAAAWAAVILGALLVVIAAAFLGPASTLQTKMTQRFQEVDAQARTQREALAAEQRRAEEARLVAERQAEEARRREQAEREAEARQRRELEERQRAPARLAELAQEWRNLTQAYRPAVRDIQGFALDARHALQNTSRPIGSREVPPQYAEGSRCADPPPPAGDRDSNISVCTRYVAFNPTAVSLLRQDLQTALYWRAFVRGSADDLPMPDLVAYVWLDALIQAAQQERPPPSLPPLTDGPALHLQLMRGILAPGFARRLLDTVTPREEERLRARVWPEMLRLSDMLTEAQLLCRLIQRAPPCLPTDPLPSL